MKPLPDLSIIIVNWNSADFLRACIESIYKTTHNLRFEIVVVDSASYDGCGKMLESEFPEVVFIQSAENLGFAKANNLGVRNARADTVLFLNPDTKVLGSAIKILYRHLQSLPDAGAVGCKLLNPDFTLQDSCVQAIPTILNQILDCDALRAWFPRARLWGTEVLLTDDPAPRPVEMLSGACIMMPRKVFERIGMFSEDYFMYSEDADLCYKIQEAGCQNYYVPSGTILHYGGSSSQQSRSEFATVMTRESICRFLTKTRGRGYGLGYRLAMMFTAICRLMLLSVALPLQTLRGRFAAHTQSLRKWFAVLTWSVGVEVWVKSCQHSKQPV